MEALHVKRIVYNTHYMYFSHGEFVSWQNQRWHRQRGVTGLTHRNKLVSRNRLANVNIVLSVVAYRRHKGQIAAIGLVVVADVYFCFRRRRKMINCC